jgi:hypothetical protein
MKHALPLLLLVASAAFAQNVGVKAPAYFAKMHSDQVESLTSPEGCLIWRARRLASPKAKQSDLAWMTMQCLQNHLEWYDKGHAAEYQSATPSNQAAMRELRAKFEGALYSMNGTEADMRRARASLDVAWAQFGH